ncbi:hypothetical protein HYS30_01340 [Candidatus Peregrinibacteria bacterium]|nr:hypothetical protein [Candidatus Peregrinibacteria bacterium]MBI2524006.1 hypothetical protein [Candidatus Peregrinibacteria bacterium]
MAKQTLPFSLVTVLVAGISLVTGMFVLPGSDLSAVFRSQADGGYSLEELQAHRGDWREQRRLYSRAIETCRDRRQDGQVIDCTTIKINDPATFQPFLTDAVSSAVPPSDVSHAAAEDLKVDALSALDRSLLRRYQRAGSCPITLKTYLPGFYELCVRVIEETQFPPPAAKKRIQSMPVPPPLTADDIAKAKKRPVPTVRVGVKRHQESRFSSSAASSQ